MKYLIILLLLVSNTAYSMPKFSIYSVIQKGKIEYKHKYTKSLNQSFGVSANASGIYLITPETSYKFNKFTVKSELPFKQNITVKYGFRF